MAALTKGRQTKRRGTPYLISLKMAAAGRVFCGGLVSINTATGGAVAASDAASRVVAGIATADVDNTSGALGDKSVTVETQCEVRLPTGGGTPITQAHVGLDAHVEDDQTIERTSTNTVLVGKITELDANGEAWAFLAFPTPIA
jgi:hypothetical protein